MNPPARTRLSAETRAAIGLTDTVEAALDGLTAAKIAARPGDPYEASIAWVARYLHEHEFTPEEIVDLVWEAARILDGRADPERPIAREDSGALQRERADHRQSLRELQTAAILARSLGSPDRRRGASGS